MRENIFTQKSAAIAVNDNQTAIEMRAESHKQSAAPSAEKTSNQNIALNDSSVTVSAISGGGNPHRPASGLNSGKHLTGLTRLASLLLAPLVLTALLAACGGGGGSSGSSGGGASAPAGVISNPSGNVAGFPDDGAVSYTLNITRQNIASPTSSWNVTATTTGGTCSITPPSATPLDYGTNNQTTTSFNIEFTGTATVGGSCVVNFAINEAEQIRNLRRTVTFNAELAPTLVSSLIGSGTNIPASIPVRVALTATKRDAGKNLDITFLNNIVSDGSPSCTATLADAASQYITAAGIFTAVATYNVRPTIIDAVSNCGVFRFNATEGSASGSTGFSAAINFLSDSDRDGIADSMDNCPLIANPGQSDLNSDGEGDVCDTNSDSDTDGVMDASDVDADGDGLIELRTVTQLNMMRNNLAGTNLTITADGAGNSMGCGGGSYSNGTDITTCNGYEQMANFDLNDLPDNAIPGHNWEPVGTCGSNVLCRVAVDGAQLFSGMFSGNDFTISNLFINVATERFVVSFFGAISPDAELRNVHIRGGNITAATSQRVGGLVGFGNGATISSSSVTLAAISGISDVGGLAGSGGLARISNSSVTLAAISGASNVGGLVGFGQSSMINSSSVNIAEISGTGSVGGLAGSGDGVRISSSVATVGSIIGTSTFVGGLVGFGQFGKIYSSVAIVNSISGTSSVGGLAGSAQRGEIYSSVATVNSISGVQSVGGLVGHGLGGSTSMTTISYSFAVTTSVNGSSSVGGLVGNIGNIVETNSYWDDRVVDSAGVILAGNGVGSARTTAALTTPTDFTGTNNIYANWANAYCNPNTGEYSAAAPNPLGDFIRVWDLGEGDEYPTITCNPNFSPAQQRAAVARVVAGESPIQ